MATTTDAIKNGPKRYMGLDITLWLVQVYLAVMFGMDGFVNTFLSVPDMVANGITFASHAALWRTRFIGIAELIFAIGVIVPALTRIAPWLTSMAAAGFVAIQVLAIAFHATHGELAQALPLNLALFLPALFVLWGRCG